MLKKLKKIYPEEEIIDGFSILCFESHNKLEKFSSSLNKSLQRMILNEINRPKSNATTNTNISSPNYISEIKSKITTTPISPTRITAQRKSKPDMNTLTLAICCNKRRNSVVPPVKHVEQKIQICTEDSHCADKENEDINKANNIIEVKLTSCEEKIISEIQKEAVNEVKNDYYTSSKDDSLFTESSVNATSTLSPVSIQPVNCLQGEIELMDLDSPMKIDLGHNDDVDTVLDKSFVNDNLELSKSNNSDQNAFEIPIIDDEKDVKGCVEDEIESIKIPDITEDDDCVITSISFDPAPKLSSIPLSSVEHLLAEIPKLKPAPPFVPPPSIKTILLQNVHKSPRPPPLIPAPAYYFLSNVMVCRTNSTQNSKSKCISHKSMASPKLKSPKRCLMKSSILKTSSSSKCVKLSSLKVSKNETSNSSEKLSNPVVRSILQNTSNSKTKLFSINTLKNPGFTSLALNNSKNLLNKGTVHQINIPQNNHTVKQLTNSKTSTVHEKIRKSGILNKTNHFKNLITRKTRNHVDIANLIQKKLKLRYNNEQTFHNTSIHKPKVYKPIYRPYIPVNRITSISNNQISLSESTNQSSFNFNKQSLYRFQSKIISANHSYKQQNDPQIFIRPLNSNNTNFVSSNSVLLNSAIPNSLNFCPRPNLLLLP